MRIRVFLSYRSCERSKSPMNVGTLIRSCLLYNQTMIKPGQASDTLDIPPSTLRRLAKEFEDYLSPQTGRFREYTLEDLDTFRKIRELLSHGMTYKDVKTRLQVLEKPSEDQEPKSLAVVPELIKSLQIASDQLATLQAKTDKQDQRIKALEAWIALPWYQKLFTEPSDFTNPTSD